MASEEFPLPEFLELTQDRLAENAANQKAWREASAASAVHLANERPRAALIETDALAILDILEDEFKATADEGVKATVSAAAIHQRSRLSESLAAQGRYDEAAAVEPNARKAAELTAVWEAVQADGISDCTDPAYRTSGSRKLSNRVHIRDVFSLKRQREMPLIRCSICKRLTVTDLSPEMARAEQIQEWRKDNAR